MNSQASLFQYILKIADNQLILGHRLSEQCSKGPFLEEDIACSNIALDLIGAANSLYIYAAAIEGENKTEDDLVFLRSERAFKNVLLVEQPNTDFAYIMCRQFLFDTYDYFFQQALQKSKDETLAAIAAKTNTFLLIGEEELKLKLRSLRVFIETPFLEGNSIAGKALHFELTLKYCLANFCKT